MLTLEILYAVLQGLPPDQLNFLDEVWIVFCNRINRRLADGKDPASAFTIAYEDAGDWERRELNKVFAQAFPVLPIPGLTFRQKEVLIALRYSKAASLNRLSRILGADRSNTHRRLDVLVKRGLAFKFYGKGGVCYLAIEGVLDRDTKHKIHQVVARNFAQMQSAQPTTTTTLTTTTMSQKPTTSTTS